MAIYAAGGPASQRCTSGAIPPNYVGTKHSLTQRQRFHRARVYGVHGGVKQTREGKSEVHCQLGQHSRGAQQILMKLGAGALTELHFATRPLFDPPMPVPM